MSHRDDLLKARFLTNMGRINGLVRLVNSNDSLKPIRSFQSEGVKADLLRSIVVFLHATFEVVLRSHIPNQRNTLTFYAGNDIDKVLKKSNIDPQPFQSLYPPLTQLAKRRKQIVHEADLPQRTATVAEAWGVVDDWQLPMWLMAVAAFYYQMRISTKVASLAEQRIYRKHKQAMASHVEFANQLLAFPKVLPELQVEALQKIVVTLRGIAATLTSDASESLAHPDAPT